MTYRHSETAGTGRFWAEAQGKTVDSHKTVVKWWMTVVLVSIGFVMVVTHSVAGYPL
ncbi:MAG: hypothetical protein V7709_13020 [Halioglobus sp.]